MTVNIGTIEGGTSPNLVPTHAIARADIRLPVGITTDVLAARLDDWLAPLDGVSWRAIRRFEASFTPPDAEIVVRTARVAAEVLGSAPAVNMRVGGSDSRWYRPAGVPTWFMLWFLASQPLMLLVELDIALQAHAVLPAWLVASKVFQWTSFAVVWAWTLGVPVVLGHRFGVGSDVLLSYRDARYQIYLPAYRWTLENRLATQVEKLRSEAAARTVVLLDYETNGDVEDLSSPLSHAALIKHYLEGKWPSPGREAST